MWKPGYNPFRSNVKKILDFKYLSPLKFKFHPHYKDEYGRTYWQLTHDYEIQITLRYKEDRYDQRPDETTIITAPRGMYTDLSSVPKVLWNIVQPYGEHLPASIIHDYLFMAWTDYKIDATMDDFDFANKVFAAGLEASNAPKSWLLKNAVKITPVWNVFRDKPWTFKERINIWLGDLYNE